jgi:hypothetical protein
VRIVSRAEWGARPPRYQKRIATPTRELWIHHSGDNAKGAAGVRAIQRFHMDTRGWSDIAYSFLIDNDTGTIYEGRGWGIQGGHTRGHNTISHAICFMGNFEVITPTREALLAGTWLFHEGHRRRQWIRVSGGHRDASGASTSCPGRNLYRLLGALSIPPYKPPAPTPTPPPVPVGQDGDMDLIYDKDAKAYHLVGAFGIVDLSVAEGYTIDTDSETLSAIVVPGSAWQKIKAAHS